MNSVLLIILDFFVVSNAIIVQYECGEHGRFEYCIDGIPGCVIGCHCHPGYYFDTETKICEPNAKLIQAYKPQRIPERINAETEGNFSMINQKVDAITNDTSDISDWLYNQFFKTIENGVLNNTKEPVANTRRSGNDVLKKGKTPKRKPRPKRKKKKTKRKNRNSLRRKYLRISPDDSMFDEQDNKKYKSREDEDEDDDDDDDDDEDDKDDDSEDDDDDDSDVSKNDSGDHGHKEFIMFSKTAKPSLPSYIFLPNMQSPFYPSIGLPPAPVMQPMIPVPPMFPYYGHPHSHDDTDTNDIETTIKTTKAATTESSPTTAMPNHSSLNSVSTINTEPEITISIKPEINNTIKPEINSTIKPDATNKPETEMEEIERKLRNGYDVWKQPERTFPHRKIKIPHRQRNKLPSLEQRIRQLHEHIKSKKNKPNIDRDNLSEIPFMSKMQEIQTPLNINSDIPDDPYNGDSFAALRRKWDKDNKDDIDLNFLRDISSKEDFNSDYFVSQNNLHESKTRRDMTTSPFYSTSKPGSQVYKERSNFLKVNDNENVYYTNLGKEIAALIKNMNSKLGKELILEVDEFHKTGPGKLNYDRFHNSPKSYWERSVRSPMKQLTKFDDVRKVNSKLFDIEDKVEEAVATTPKLSLPELENIINIMQTSHLIVNHNEKENLPISATKSLNVDLFERQFEDNLSQTYIADDKNDAQLESVENIELGDLKYDTKKPTVKTYPIYPKNVTYGKQIQSNPYSTAVNTQRQHITVNNKAAYGHPNYKIKQNDYTQYKNVDITRPSQNHKLKNLPTVASSYTNLKSNNNNNQFYKKISFPNLPVHNKVYEKPLKTPYFHHEYQRYFDSYFD